MQLHIGNLRSLEDSERVRAACIQYLQNYLVVFYGQRPDIVDQMHEVARGLGGALRDPRLSWKYAWIKSLFGWSLAKRAQLIFPSVKWAVLRSLDRVQFSIEEKFLPKEKEFKFEDGGVAGKSQIHARRQEAEAKQRRKSGS